MAFWCPVPGWTTIDDHTRIWATCYIQNGALLVSSLVRLQMMGARRWNHVFMKLSRGILGQLDTRSLSQGIPDLEDPRCGATGTLQMQLLCCVLTVMVIHIDSSDIRLWWWQLFVSTPHELAYAEANTILEIHAYSYLCIACYGEIGLVVWWSEKKVFHVLQWFKSLDLSGNCTCVQIVR